VCSLPIIEVKPIEDGEAKEPEENKQQEDEKDKTKDINPKYRDWIVC
jgi:hypothetical protein